MAIQNIDAKTLKQWLDSNEAILIDVRQPEEYKTSHIPNAVNIPLATLTWSSLPPQDNKKLVMQCAAGKRSNAGCETLLASCEDPSIILYNLEGGINAWTQANYPVKGQKDALAFQSMPVQKQNHLILGGIILLFSLLALVFSVIWILIPAFIGAVMLYEGLSDTNLIDEWLGKLPFRK